MSSVRSLFLGVLADDTITLPATMTDLTSGAWILSGSAIMNRGETTLRSYMLDLDNITVGMKIGICRKQSGELHFYKDGVDQGVAATGLPKGKLMHV